MKPLRWIDDGPRIICPDCKAEYPDEIVFISCNLGPGDLNYCPNCGAKMIDGEAGEDDPKASG